MTVRRHFRLFPLLAAIAWPAAALAAGPAEEAVDMPAGVETIVEAAATVRGRVAGIDVGQRRLTLETGTGTRVMPVDPDVPGLERLHVGDLVDVRYHRSILFDIQPAGSGEPGAWLRHDAHPVDGGQAGELEVTVLATVIEVDAGAGAFTVQGASGNVRTLRAERPDHREAVGRIRVGDLLRVRFREGTAVSVAQAELH